jgi:hypothetical protein
MGFLGEKRRIQVHEIELLWNFFAAQDSQAIPQQDAMRQFVAH